MLGASVQRWYNENEILQGINSSTDFIHTMNAFAANLDLTQTGTWISKHSLASVFSRITYDYAVNTFLPRISARWFFSIL